MTAAQHVLHSGRANSFACLEKSARALLPALQPSRFFSSELPGQSSVSVPSCGPATLLPPLYSCTGFKPHLEPDLLSSEAGSRFT